MTNLMGAIDIFFNIEVFFYIPYEFIRESQLILCKFCK